MSRILLRGGRVLDPATHTDKVCDLLMENGVVREVGENLSAEGADVRDVSGKWVAPGFCDMHVHFREPGLEYKEDMASGGRAAVAGGFTSVACMANTEPVNDDPAVTDFIIDRARADSPARVYPIAAATKGLKGEVMTEMAALVEAGAVAFSDDGATIMDGGVMRNVLQYSCLVKKPVIVHAEDCCIRGNGVVNEGPVSTRLGLPGNPTAAEDVLVARDIALAKVTGAHVHIAHVSSAGAVELIRDARAKGIHVTAEVTPHHIELTDEATLGYDTNTKMAPPLRTQADVDACQAGLVDGTIDCIATDHAPHAVHEKETDFIEAPCGIIGLETALPVCLGMVRSGALSPLEMMRRLSTGGAKLLNCPGGSLKVGAVADVVVIDPDLTWTYDPMKGYSKSRNSPWSGKTLTGRVLATYVDGKLVFDVNEGVLLP